MAGNTFGQLFRVTTWGESHGGAIGAVIDGCPPRVKLAQSDIQIQLDRRRPGQSKLTTARAEEDQVQILSGVFKGQTLGTPISLLIWNKDAKSADYEHLKDVYRPGHADFTYEKKYGIRDYHGGGRASARETAARVAAGAIARKVLTQAGVEILAYVTQVGSVRAVLNPQTVTYAAVESNAVRCPDHKSAQAMSEAIVAAKAEQDSLGGVVECVVRGLPIGLGEPVFDKITAELAKACMSIPATRGFEIGSGFEASAMHGSEHNDPLVTKSAQPFATNHAGGVLGGITNGDDLVFKVAFKPPSTIGKEQQTVNTNGESVTLFARGRHDPCVVPRAVPVVEAMAAITLLDHLMRHRAQCT